MITCAAVTHDDHTGVIANERKGETVPLTPALRRHLALTALIPVLAVPLTGCGSDTGNSVTTTPAVRPPPATQSATQSATSQPSPSIPAASRAVADPADGTNLRACTDRTCEVQVTAGDTIRFAAKYEINKFTVERISGNKFHFKAYDDQPTPLSGYIGGTGNIRVADLQLDLLRIDGRHAIVRLQPRPD